MLCCSCKAAKPVGYVFTQFPCGTYACDTAGGDDPNENYFVHESGIEQRDSSGNLLRTIELPAAIYGIASDGGSLYASSDCTIYRYLGGTRWDLGMNTSERNAYGLAVTPQYFILIVDDGFNLALINRTGHTEHKIAIPTEIGQSLGLDYITSTKELALTTGTADIFRLKLSANFDAITSWSSIRVSGLGASSLMGVGFNSALNMYILNDSGMGQYAVGPLLCDFDNSGTINFTDLALMFSDCGERTSYDLDGDSEITMNDLALFSNEWLKTNQP